MNLLDLFESQQQCPECGGISFSDLILAEKKDACYYKVKASAKVWPSAYASGRLVQCRKKGADNYGKSKNEGVAEAINPDITNPAFGHQQQIGDYLYVARYWSKGLKISAYDGDKQIGYAELMYQSAPFDDFADPKTTPKRVWLESEWTKVNPKYQRQGIMSTMYAYAKMLGNSVKPSQTRSDDAKAAWASWRQSGDVKHLTSNEGVAEGLNEFDAQGFQQRYTLYKDGYEIEKFGDMDDAIEYAEDDRRDGDDPSAVYKIVDINKQVVWDSDPYEKPSRIQLRKSEHGVGEAKSPAEFIGQMKKLASTEQQFNVGDWVTIDPNETSGYASSGMIGRIIELYDDEGESMAKIAVGGGSGVQKTLGKGVRSSGTHTVVPTSILQKDDPRGVAEGSTDTIYPNAEVIKSKNGRPVGEIYQDENGWGFFHYGMDGGNDFIDSREDAIQGLKDFHAENRGRRPDYTIKGEVEEGDDNFGKPAAMMRPSAAAAKTAQSILQKQADKNVIGMAKLAGAVPAQGVGEVNNNKIGGRYDPEEFDSMVQRLKKLAGVGPMKTVYDPQRRVYRNVPVAQQPDKK